jgi:hypothetical protein
MPNRVLPPTAMTEAELLDNVIALGHLFGWKIAHFRPALTKHGWRTPVSADGKGFPDLVLTRDRVVFAELKSHRGSLADEQVDWQHALVSAGAEYHVWRPDDWLDGSIEAVLRSRS